MISKRLTQTIPVSNNNRILLLSLILLRRPPTSSRGPNFNVFSLKGKILSFVWPQSRNSTPLTLVESPPLSEKREMAFSEDSKPNYSTPGFEFRSSIASIRSFFGSRCFFWRFIFVHPIPFYLYLFIYFIFFCLALSGFCQTLDV